MNNCKNGRAMEDHADVSKSVFTDLLGCKTLVIVISRQQVIFLARELAKEEQGCFLHMFPDGKVCL